MTSRVWLFEDMRFLPQWKAFERVKKALWVVSDGEPQIYHGFVELDSPQKISYCKKIIDAKWYKCDKLKKAEYINTPYHEKYEANRTNAKSNQGLANDDILRVMKMILEEMTIIKKQMSDLQDKCLSLPQPSIIGNNNNTNNTNNTTINNTLNIIQSFGNEDYDHLSKDFLTQCVKKQGSGIVELIKAIHFNPKHPKYMNVRAKSMKSVTNRALLQTYNGCDWEFVDRDRLLLRLFTDKCNILDGHFCDYEPEIKELVGQQRYTLIDEWLNKARNQDKSITKAVTKDTLLMIMNKTIPSSHTQS